MVIMYLPWCTSQASIKFGLKFKFDHEDQQQSIPQTTGVITNVCCTPGPHLVILAWMGDKLWCGQAQNVVYIDFEVTFDLAGHDQLPLKTIAILTKVFYPYDLNLILAWRGDESWRGQTRGGHTRTHAHTQRKYKINICFGIRVVEVTHMFILYFLSDIFVNGIYIITETSLRRQWVNVQFLCFHLYVLIIDYMKYLK